MVEWFKYTFTGRVIYRILKKMRIGVAAPSNGDGTPPPKHIPNELETNFTMNGAIPVINWYFDERRSRPVKNTKYKYKYIFSLLIVKNLSITVMMSGLFMMLSMTIRLLVKRF